jgi:hypothetical protein
MEVSATAITKQTSQAGKNDPNMSKEGAREQPLSNSGASNNP